MKLRYIDNLNIRTEFPVVVPCVQIPPLLFISLLENAFKHGVSYQEPSFIEVRIELADEGVIFNCKNSKHTHAHKDAYHGIGIDNIKEKGFICCMETTIHSPPMRAKIVLKFYLLFLSCHDELSDC